MRIVIDLQGAQTESRYRGIGRYSLSFAKALVRNRANHEVIIALNGLLPETIEPIRAEFEGLLSQENIRVWVAPAPVRECTHSNSWRREVAELIREVFLASLQPDVIHISSLFEGYADDAVTSIGLLDDKTLVSTSFYDLIPFKNPDCYLKANPSYEAFYWRKIDNLHRSSLLLAISEYTQQEGIDALGLNDTSIINISTAVSTAFHPISMLSRSQKLVVMNKFGLSRPFLLYTGGADERKNLPRLIRAFARLPVSLRNAHQLVFAGYMPKDNINQLHNEAENAGLNPGDLVFTGYVTDDELVKLYNMCKLYVFPSWHEGFGLPALEAMSCGAAVIAASTSSLPEVVGNADALFDPFSEDSISEKIASALTNESFRQSLIEQGLNQAKLFSWDASARRAIAAFENMFCATASSKDCLYDDALLSKLVSSIGAISANGRCASELIPLAQSIAICLPTRRQGVIFIDISELAQRDAGTGIQRVTKSILKELINNPPDGYVVEPVYATMNDISYRYARDFAARYLGVAVNGDDEYIEYQVGDIFLGLDLQHIITRAQSRFLTLMHQQGVKVLFVVYDLLPVQFPHFWPSGNSLHSLHSEWLCILAMFDGAICISRSVADELKDWLDENGPERHRLFKIGWFHLGADYNDSEATGGVPDDAESVLNTIKKASSFLMVGTIEPRKSYEQVLAAFDLLWADGYELNCIIVGKQGWMVEKLVERINNHPMLGKRLFWLAGISDVYLEKIYSACTALIAASVGEGFGLPLIEAAQHNLPIIVRDIPVFREVAGEHASYFSGERPEDLSAALKDWLKCREAGMLPRSDTLPWLTWAESTQQLIDPILNSNSPQWLHSYG